MRKIAKLLAVISFIVIVIDLGIIGFKILDNNYFITTEGYIWLISFVVFLICVSYVKLKNRCPYCGKIKQSFGKYCPYCGKEIN